MVETPDELRWTAHPFRQRRGAAILALLVIAGVTAASYWASGGQMWGYLAAPVLLVSLNRFFIPSRYEMDATGVTARYAFTTRRREWQDVERWAADAHGAILLPRKSGPKSRQRDRGMQILFGTQRSAVLDRLRFHLDGKRRP